MEEIDGFIIGPYDLSASIGVPGQFDHPDFLNAVKRINIFTEKMDILRGIHIIEPNVGELNGCIEQGYRFIGYSLDIRMIDVASRSAIENAKPTNS